MNLEERVLSLRDTRGDSSQLIREYLPYIAACASRHTGHTIGPGADEMSVAMAAFHEAIQNYDGLRGKFLSYASMVIRHRLIDYARCNGAVREIPFSALTGSADEDAEPFEIADSSQQDRRNITQEIQSLSEELLPFGIDFDDLPAASPRSAKTRRACAAAVRALLADRTALQRMMETHLLPIAELAKLCCVPRKTLERHRKYIVTAAVILVHDYPCLSEYIRPITGGQD